MEVRGSSTAEGAEAEVAEAPAAEVLEGDPQVGAVGRRTESVAQTEVEAGQTAAAVALEPSVEQQGRTTLATWASCPRRLRLFPRQPRREHRRPLGWQSG